MILVLEFLMAFYIKNIKIMIPTYRDVRKKAKKKKEK